ncbi:competence/damage-inducible protein A [Lacticaseibacillus porcinae]|uniref:competence/damage-inducible protein A n=1 Tax=Lacticaseibacillus porcinae TaxID=1123687 RepID=UPI000F7BB0DF|nr:competence/damage-inducible protein A [Lacticaseibacillus porcinae]
MQAEIIAVGTEILLGQIVNSNASFLAKQFADLGIDSLNQQVVGDNPERMEQALQLADSRADVVVLLGGLGPTKDDLSKQVLAKHLGVDLATDQPAHDKLAHYAEQQHHTMTPNNWVQAQYPEGSHVLANHVGLAVGAVYEAPAHRYILLPGPPKEFKPMVLDQLVPYLLKVLGGNSVLQSKVLRFFGIGESALVTELQDLIEQQTNPTIAPYIKDWEVTLRITAKADSEAAAQALIAPMQKAVLDRVGQYFYGFGDDNSLAKVAVKALADHHLTLTAAESLTAGAFQSALGDVAGVSEWFKGGFVTYSNYTKALFLGLDEATINADGAVSEPTAIAMADGALAKADADIAISFTGVAGPGPSEGQEAGTVWIGLAQPGKATTATLYHFPGARADVRGRAVKAGLFTIYQALNA